MFLLLFYVQYIRTDLHIPPNPSEIALLVISTVLHTPNDAHKSSHMKSLSWCSDPLLINQSQSATITIEASWAEFSALARLWWGQNLVKTAISASSHFHYVMEDRLIRSCVLGRGTSSFWTNVRMKPLGGEIFRDSWYLASTLSRIQLPLHRYIWS